MHLVSNIDFFHGTIGGIILGISSTLLLLFTGQITGISGFLEGLISRNGEDWHWSYLFGLVLSGYFMSLYHKEYFDDTNTTTLLSTNAILISGLLIGFGTRLGSGCTSGHGLCGLSRLSIRSLVAVLNFMTSGAIASYITYLPSIRPLLLSSYEQHLIYDNNQLLMVFLTVVIIVLSRTIDQNYSKQNNQDSSKKKSSSIYIHIISFLCGYLFGIGLIISGMSSSQRVIRFLNIFGIDGWDPTLISVLCSGVIINLITFNIFKISKQQVLYDNHKNLGTILNIGLVKQNLDINWKLILGSLLFGIGWGISGLCPGPAIVNFGTLSNVTLRFIPSVIIGMILKKILMS